MKFLKLYSLLIAFSLVFSTGCAIPKRSLAHLDVSGRLLSSEGTPLANKKVELLVPAGYGLEDEDIENRDLSRHDHSNQKVLLKTDALGSFTASFKPISYPAEYWLLPPLGTTPDHAPYPFFYIRLPSNPQEFYSVVFIDEKKANLLVHQPMGIIPLKRSPTSPVKITGRLLPQPDKEKTGWIADLTLRYLPRRRARYRTGSSPYLK